MTTAAVLEPGPAVSSAGLRSSSRDPAAMPSTTVANGGDKQQKLPHAAPTGKPHWYPPPPSVGVPGGHHTRFLPPPSSAHGQHAPFPPVPSTSAQGQHAHASSHAANTYMPPQPMVQMYPSMPSNLVLDMGKFLLPTQPAMGKLPGGGQLRLRLSGRSLRPPVRAAPLSPHRVDRETGTFSIHALPPRGLGGAAQPLVVMADPQALSLNGWGPIETLPVSSVSPKAAQRQHTQRSWSQPVQASHPQRDAHPQSTFPVPSLLGSGIAFGGRSVPDRNTPGTPQQFAMNNYSQVAAAAGPSWSELNDNDDLGETAPWMVGGLQGCVFPSGVVSGLASSEDDRSSSAHSDYHFEELGHSSLPGPSPGLGLTIDLPQTQSLPLPMNASVGSTGSRRRAAAGGVAMTPPGTPVLTHTVPSILTPRSGGVGGGSFTSALESYQGFASGAPLQRTAPSSPLRRTAPCLTVTTAGEGSFAETPTKRKGSPAPGDAWNTEIFAADFRDGFRVPGSDLQRVRRRSMSHSGTSLGHAAPGGGRGGRPSFGLPAAPPHAGAIHTATRARAYSDGRLAPPPHLPASWSAGQTEAQAETGLVQGRGGGASGLGRYEAGFVPSSVRPHMVSLGRSVSDNLGNRDALHRYALSEQLPLHPGLQAGANGLAAIPTTAVPLDKTPPSTPPPAQPLRQSPKKHFHSASPHDAFAVRPLQVVSVPPSALPLGGTRRRSTSDSVIPRASHGTQLAVQQTAHVSSTSPEPLWVRPVGVQRAGEPNGVQGGMFSSPPQSQAPPTSVRTAGSASLYSSPGGGTHLYVSPTTAPSIAGVATGSHTSQPPTVTAHALTPSSTHGGAYHQALQHGSTPPAVVAGVPLVKQAPPPSAGDQHPPSAVHVSGAANAVHVASDGSPTSQLPVSRGGGVSAALSIGGGACQAPNGNDVSSDTTATLESFAAAAHAINMQEHGMPVPLATTRVAAAVANRSVRSYSSGALPRSVFSPGNTAPTPSSNFVRAATTGRNVFCVPGVSAIHPDKAGGASAAQAGYWQQGRGAAQGAAERTLIKSHSSDVPTSVVGSIHTGQSLDGSLPASSVGLHTSPTSYQLRLHSSQNFNAGNEEQEDGNDDGYDDDDDDDYDDEFFRSDVIRTHSGEEGAAAAGGLHLYFEAEGGVTGERCDSTNSNHQRQLHLGRAGSPPLLAASMVQ